MKIFENNVGGVGGDGRGVLFAGYREDRTQYK